MINLRGKRLAKFYSCGTPVLPSGSDKSLTGIIRLNQIKGNKKRGKKSIGGGFGGIGGSGFTLLPPLKNNWKTRPSTQSDEFINLFSIYGNILTKEPELLIPFSPDNPSNFINYPIDTNLLNLFENSAEYWYDKLNKNESSKKNSIAVLSLKAPSRSSTWKLAKYLAAKSGKSHLAIIPFQMFHDLLTTCNKNLKMSVQDVQEAQEFGGLILSKIIKDKSSYKKASSDLIYPAKSDHINSRSVIQVCEYLFACMESLLNRRDQVGQRYTLLLDGVEEYLRSNKGGDTMMKDLISWLNLFESTGRKVILGLRTSSDSITKNLDFHKDEENDNSIFDNFPEEGSDESKNTKEDKIIRNKSGSSSSNSIQMMTSFIMDVVSNEVQRRESVDPVTNVFIDGSIMRLFLTAPNFDNRKKLTYNQLISIERKKDRFDSNLNLLAKIAKYKWNEPLDLNLKSKYDFPSDHSDVWSKLSSTGRGVLTRDSIINDEFNEVIITILGQKKPLNIQTLSSAIDSISTIRHDPSQMSSEDLNHLLSERQILISNLNKYEKRFINCISTSTTQTHFNDITLPKDTIGTLKTLTTLPLTHPELFSQGILKNSLTGVLLFGPPGTGKTMLARAVAQESGASFLSVNMSNIFDMYVGEGEKNVKGMFSLARKLSPAIIFIDEIDALLERRSSISGRSSRLEIVNEFMSQWDGLSSNLNSGVIVMGATNRPFVLDDAVLRRLPRRLLIDLPDASSRLEIVKKLLKENLCEISLLEALQEITSKMEFYSGSDLKNVAITAALKSANRFASSKSNQMIISKEDFEEAVREVPASLSDQMESLMDLRQWNEMYGETKKGEFGKKIKKFGFSH